VQGAMNASQRVGRTRELAKNRQAAGLCAVVPKRRAAANAESSHQRNCFWKPVTVTGLKRIWLR